MTNWVASFLVLGVLVCDHYIALEGHRDGLSLETIAWSRMTCIFSKAQLVYASQARNPRAIL